MMTTQTLAKFIQGIEKETEEARSESLRSMIVIGACQKIPLFLKKRSRPAKNPRPSAGENAATHFLLYYMSKTNWIMRIEVLRALRLIQTNEAQEAYAKAIAGEKKRRVLSALKC